MAQWLRLSVPLEAIILCVTIESSTLVAVMSIEPKDLSKSPAKLAIFRGSFFALVAGVMGARGFALRLADGCCGAIAGCKDGFTTSSLKTISSTLLLAKSSNWSKELWFLTAFEAPSVFDSADGSGLDAFGVSLTFCTAWFVFALRRRVLMGERRKLVVAFTFVDSAFLLVSSVKSINKCAAFNRLKWFRRTTRASYLDFRRLSTLTGVLPLIAINQHRDSAER